MTNKYITKQKRSCSICKKDFQPISNSQSVCICCRTKRCRICGKEYVLKEVGRISLSDTCSRKCYFKKRYPPLTKCRSCDTKIKRGFGYYCSIKCCRKYNNDYWHKVKKESYRKRRLDLIQSLGGKCVGCGISDPIVLEINHTDRSKKHRSKHYTWSRRFKDWELNIKNIELLCANCHRRFTRKQLGWQTRNTAR